MSFIAAPHMRGDGLMVKVECLRNYVIKPGHPPFQMERIPSLKNIKPADAKIFGVNLWRPKKDMWGNKIPNLKAYVYPLIARSLAREKIFDPRHPVCAKCKRCVTR